MYIGTCIVWHLQSFVHSCLEASLGICKAAGRQSPWSHRYSEQPVCVGFVVDIATLRQVFLPVLQFSPVSIIPPMLLVHLSITDVT